MLTSPPSDTCQCGAAEQAEIRELKRRNQLLEQENEVLRRVTAYLRSATADHPQPSAQRRRVVSRCRCDSFAGLRTA
jgi:transposase-like protein